MTRIRRMHLSIGERKEWISLLSAKKPDTHRVITEDDEEFEFVDNKKEPLETQIVRILSERTAPVAD